MKEIICSDFKKVISLQEWQSDKGLDFNKVSEHIDINNDNVQCEGVMILAQDIIEAFENIRNIYGNPIAINSGYRTQIKQDELTAKGLKTARFSPHVRGYALDLGFNVTQQGFDLLKACREYRDNKYPFLRIGWNSYWASNQKFIHIDCCPKAYKMTKDETMPEAWRKLKLEW